MWMRCNVNPAKNNTGDCVIRACAIALNKTWERVSDEIYELSRKHYLSMSDDRLWIFSRIQRGYEAERTLAANAVQILNYILEGEGLLRGNSSSLFHFYQEETYNDTKAAERGRGSAVDHRR